MKLVSESFAGLATAASRVVELTYPEDERLFRDPLALALLPWGWRLLLRLLYRPGLRDRALALRERRMPGVLGGLLCRTRYIDDVLRASLGEGTEQVVILGAGFDTRAYRIEGMDRVHVFEVDLPDTVRSKRARVEAVLGEVPAHVTFVGLDFERQTLGAALEAVGFQGGRRTLFIWEGVTQYITADAVDATLEFIAGTFPGSAVVFTYIRQGIIEGTACTDAERRVSAFARRAGSPWIFGLDPAGLVPYLAQRGLALVEDVGAAEYRERYLVPLGREMAVFAGEMAALAKNVATLPET